MIDFMPKKIGEKVIIMSEKKELTSSKHFHQKLIYTFNDYALNKCQVNK